MPTFLENNKILDIILKLYIQAYIPKSIVKLTLEYKFEYIVSLFSSFTSFKILLFSKNVGSSCYSLCNFSRTITIFVFMGN